MKLKNKNEKKQTLYSYKSASSSSSMKRSRQDDLEENSFANTTTTITNTTTPYNDSSLDYDNYTKKSFPLCGIICTKSLVIIVDALFLVCVFFLFFLMRYKIK